MHRKIEDMILKDFGKKIQLLSGPRQVGKTTLSQSLKQDAQYLSYDRMEHRQILQNAAWDRSKPLIILDELHKMPRWKQWLKGIYDTEQKGPAFFVTGSARLDTFRKLGDSLAGRFFQYRLNPLTLNELKLVDKQFDAQTYFHRLMNCSGFPEPFLEGETSYYLRWRSAHLDIMLRQDLMDLETVSSLIGLEQLIQLLSQQVGSLVSYSSLARVLQVSDKTVKRWLGLLESIYVIFRVTPYSGKLSQSIVKAPKFYFYDIARVDGHEGVRFENLVALALQSEIDYLKDTSGLDYKLHFVRKKDGRELDFVITSRQMIHSIYECKWRDGNRSENFSIANEFCANETRKVQLVGVDLFVEKTFADGCEVRSAAEWLSKFSLDDARGKANLKRETS